VKMICGLGNPGRQYAHTRHNIGFDTLDLFAGRKHLKILSRQAKALTATLDMSGQSALLVKPQTYMNLSGESVAYLARKFRVLPQDLIVVVDDLDLPLGKIRIRGSGSSGGHKGLASIIARLGSADFVRIRVGIGRQGDAIDHVLSRFNRREQEIVEAAISTAADALDAILEDGLEAAMNRYNGVGGKKDKEEPKPGTKLMACRYLWM